MKRKAKKTGAFYAFARFLLCIFFFPIYRIRVRGRENIPGEGSVLFCCNHISMKDPMILGIAQRRQVFYMAKEELFHNAFIGAVLRGLGAFPVKRGTGGGDALQEGYDILEENGAVGVFIEGSRSKDGRLQKPKTGAALLAYRTGAAVVPVCITAEDGKFSKPFHRTTIEFGKPISQEEMTIPDDSSMSLRRASRTIMGRIQDLRKEELGRLGLPIPEPEAKIERN